MNQAMKTMNTNRGFTLIEMIVTMGLVIVVIMITSSAFNSILKSTSKITSSEESNIEGVVGLEMFRHDLQQIGFGLPHAFLSVPLEYSEAVVAPANTMNDAATSPPVPRAVASWESIAGGADSTSETGKTYNVLSGTDYLALKATTLGQSAAAQKWTFVAYSSGGKNPNTWLNTADNFKTSDKVIVLNRSFSATGQVTNTLMYDIDTPSSYWPSNPTANMNDVFNPANAMQVNYLYGVSADNTPHQLSMPFNRADYFVARPSTTASIPTTCASGVGILYKANVNHADGKLTYYPLLDCVADMQVVFGWDLNGNGVIDESGAYNSNVAMIPVSSTIGTTSAAIKAIMESPTEIRNKLRYIKVYLMVQEGRKDTNFTNTNNLLGNTLSIVVGEPGPTPPSNVSLTKGYTVAQLTANGWLNYRWKTYKIVVRPKNLASN